MPIPIPTHTNTKISIYLYAQAICYTARSIIKQYFYDFTVTE